MVDLITHKNLLGTIKLKKIKIDFQELKVILEIIFLYLKKL